MDSPAGREWQVGGDSTAAGSGDGTADSLCRRSEGRASVAGNQPATIPHAPGRWHWQGGSLRGSAGLLPKSARASTARSVPWLERSHGTPTPARRPVLGRWRTSGPTRSWRLDSRKSAIRLAIDRGPLGSSAASVWESLLETARAAAVSRQADARGCRGVPTHTSTAHAGSRRSSGRTEDINARRARTSR